MGLRGVLRDHGPDHTPIGQDTLFAVDPTWSRLYNCSHAPTPITDLPQPGHPGSPGPHCVTAPPPGC